MANRWENNGNSERLYFLGLQNHCRWCLQPRNKKTLAPWKKSYNQSRQYIKKQRHYFADKGPSSQSMVFPVVMCGCESWTIKKTESPKIDTFELSCWKRLLKVPWMARSNQSVLKEISPEYSLEGLLLKLKLQYFGHLMQKTNSLGKTLMLGKIEGRRGDDRRWGDWMASPTQWTWVWINSRSWWWTGAGGQREELRPWRRSWGRRLGIHKGVIKPQETPCSRASTPKPESVLCSHLHLWLYRGLSPITISLGEGVNVQLQVNKNSWAWQECFSLRTPLKVI